jgi:hypothetical protein
LSAGKKERYPSWKNIPTWYMATAARKAKTVLNVMEKKAQFHDDSLAIQTTVMKHGA